MDVAHLVPAKGFFPEYVRYAAELTDAPEIYHVASALVVHSALLSEHFEVYFPVKRGSGANSGVLSVEEAQNDPSIKFGWTPSNLWILVVGMSGDRKTTALDLAVEVGGDDVEELRAGIGTSPESTFDLVSRRQNALFYYPEGATFFSQFFAPYWRHGAGTFPQLYDGKRLKRELAGKRTKTNPNPKPIPIVIDRPRITMGIGVALEHLGEAKSTDWTGGLIARMILIYSRRERFQQVQLENVLGRQGLRDQLLRMRSQLAARSGMKIGFKRDAAGLFLEWSAEMDQKAQAVGAKLLPLYNRLPNHILRVAAHYAVSKYHTMIDLASMACAINLGAEVVRSIERVGELLADDWVFRTSVRVMEFLRAQAGGKVPLRDVSSRLRLAYTTLEAPLKSLAAMGEVKVYVHGETQERFIELSRHK